MTIQKTPGGCWALRSALADADLYDGVVPVPVGEAGEVLRQLGQVQTLLVPGGRRGGTGEGGVSRQVMETGRKFRGILI